ncbi:unnamed protein product [Paramecium octaurelia]|uniref:Uncharacterized protein n=1 Tax=Paramecium octaurelia TaxID=43137 RepID=A0A8S1UKS0_PAROT|nr:unnamed protein product [Paramecium octaurelia]
MKYQVVELFFRFEFYSYKCKQIKRKINIDLFFLVIANLAKRNQGQNFKQILIKIFKYKNQLQYKQFFLIKVKKMFLCNVKKRGKKQNQEAHEQQESIQNHKIGILNDNDGRLFYTQFQIKLTQEKEIQYILNESIIRREQIYDISSKLEILSNYEQIKFLTWIGSYQKNYQKIGKWTAQWKGNKIYDVGGYYSIVGKKCGIWKEIINNYWEKAKIYELGEYINGERQGFWKFILDEKEIGGGRYNSIGQKDGKWIELNGGFWQNSKVSYIGEYKNGMKIGMWDIQHENKRIGGGQYDEQFGPIGKWVELIDGFYSYLEIIYIGEYNKGKKVGRWDIKYQEKSQDSFLLMFFFILLQQNQQRWRII